MYTLPASAPRQNLSSRARELVLAALAASVVAIVVTWPMAPRFGSAGRLDTGDGRYSIWNVVWVANALTTNPRGLWDANIFYPHQDTLAYSEANLVAGVLATPVWVLTRNPYAASNSAILAAFVLAAIAMFALVRRLTRNLLAATLAGLLYGFSSFMLAHIPHIQLLMTFGLPWILIRLHAFVDDPRLGTSIWLGVALAVQALACGYYGIFGGLAVGLGFVWFGAWTGRWREPRYWLFAATAALCSVAMVAPFLAPYLDVRDAGFTRSLEEARLFRAGWRSYLASPKLVYRWVLPLLGTWRDVLFPGVLAIVFTIAAIAKLARSRERDKLPAKGHVLGFYLVLAAFAFWASFGPDAGLYAVLYHALPFMSMIRAPARLGVVVNLGLVVVGCIGFAAIERQWTGMRRRVLVAIVMSYALVRSSAGTLALVPAPPVTAAYERLRESPRAPVAEFPYFSRRGEVHRQTEYMLMSLQHWQPLLNGYSDYMPPDAWRDTLALATFPSPEGWKVLRARGARYVVFHLDWYEERERRLIEEYLARAGDYLRPIVRDDTALYEITGWPPGS
jgi:hypothetical protein